MADSKEVLKLIDQARKERWTVLNLSNWQLRSIPTEISKLINLTNLDLSDNLLTGIPTEIPKLINLSSLDLSGNLLTSVSPEIARLTHLTTLDLSTNQLTTLPPEIANLNMLTSLDLSGNEIKDMPSGIRQLTNLESLNLSANRLTRLPPEITEMINLSSLDLGRNKLTTLPVEIRNLTNLTRLDLDHNQLSKIPDEIMGLTKLTELSLSGNKLSTVQVDIKLLANLSNLELSINHLTTLPPEIASLTNLTRLGLGANYFESLPPGILSLTQLTDLNLVNNRLTSLPAEITKLVHLQSFAVYQNPVPIPFETLITMDITAIFAAIKGLETGERLNEAKMLIVGDGKVGKSSLVERLLYDTFNSTKQTTLGVEINDEMQVVQSEVKRAGEPVRLNIWDFGGQEIQHSTHQFFLTTRSLYLLVVDARKGDQIGNIEYWLKLIESFGGDSPIIIVINQMDQLKGQRELNMDRNALRAKYNIRDFVPTSCETGAGISELKSAIARQVEDMAHVKDIWPRAWLAIKRRLKEMHDDYIPVEKYLEICGEEGLADGNLRETLLDMLHVLGTVIRFPGDTQVLNPRWVTQGVYGLLTSPQLVKDQGQFYATDVGRILSGLPDVGHYPAHTHQRLIDVMKHFDLCFEFTDRPGHYLIPRHLHDNELDIPWDDANALNFQYHYVKTLPDSIISRFIVRMNQYITKQYYWKNGVFLHDGDNRAKVKADLVDRKIFISVIGKEQTRRAFLAIIRAAFAEINSNFRIEIKQMIPLPDNPKVFVSYDALLAHESKNKEVIFVYEVEKDYEVRPLVDGIEDLRYRLERREREDETKVIQRRSERPELRQPKILPQLKTQTGSLLNFVLAFVAVLGAIVVAAIAISKWVSITAGVMTGIVIVGALLTIGVVGAMDLRNRGVLEDDTFLKLMIESYKRLPLLKGSSESDDG